MSEANESEGGRTSESYCAMKKERVGCNGCEKVSTPNERSEWKSGRPAWESCCAMRKERVGRNGGVGYKVVRTIMIYSHVLNEGGLL